MDLRYFRPEVSAIQRPCEIQAVSSVFNNSVKVVGKTDDVEDKLNVAMTKRRF